MTAADLLNRAGVLLLDFDGPVCSVFAGIRAASVADQLCNVLAEGGHDELPAEVATASDPFDVFRYAATIGYDEARYVAAAFTAHEVEAVATAEPAPGAHDLIEAWHRSGRPLAIVSNNAAPAIEAYLDLYDLRGQINHVSARTGHDPARLKPSTYLLDQATAALRRRADQCVYLGDSVTDIEAAHAAGMPAIGYANKPGKRARFAAAGADAITEELADLQPVR